MRILKTIDKYIATLTEHHSTRFQSLRTAIKRPAPEAVVIGLFKEELAKFNTSKGTIRFPWDRAVSVGLVKKIVKLRVENI